jgi:outer membrane protein assembly factor BamE (lipoprotein component of BamABCDE complex)
MKSKLSALLLCSIFSAFIGCSASQNSLKVNPGMDRNEVLEIMGTPGNRQFNETREAWQYCDLKSDTENEYVVI